MNWAARVVERSGHAPVSSREARFQRMKDDLRIGDPERFDL